jgi:hypothetical protein
MTTGFVFVYGGKELVIFDSLIASRTPPMAEMMRVKDTTVCWYRRSVDLQMYQNLFSGRRRYYST